MNLIYGEVLDVQEEEGIRMGSIRVLGAIKKVPLDLLQHAVRGDKVLICDGVAISKVERETRAENQTEPNNCFGIHHSDFVV